MDKQGLKSTWDWFLLLPGASAVRACSFEQVLSVDRPLMPTRCHCRRIDSEGQGWSGGMRRTGRVPKFSVQFVIKPTWGMKVNRLLSSWRPISAIFTPSILISPSSGLTSLSKELTRELFPAAVLPTIPTRSPPLTAKEISWMAWDPPTAYRTSSLKQL